LILKKKVCTPKGEKKTTAFRGTEKGKGKGGISRKEGEKKQTAPTPGKSSKERPAA